MGSDLYDGRVVGRPETAAFVVLWHYSGWNELEIELVSTYEEAV